VRHIAALPSLALLFGAALGLFLPESPTLSVSIALTASAVSAFWCWRAGSARLFALFVTGAFFSGAVLLAAVCWQRAWRPPLRLAFEAAARDERAEAVRDGRRLPLDDEATLIVEGTLRSDASPGENGAVLAMDVDALWQGGRKSHGGLSAEKPKVLGSINVTVVGALAEERVGDWRAGRRVRMPAQLRQPSRYLDPGVPDYERALARRGVTLVGTVKSGALVELVAGGGWWNEWLASGRAVAREIIARHVGRWNPQSAAIVSAIVIGDRSSLDAALQRRLQEAGTYHVIAISGGNIAILAGLLLAAFRIAGLLGRTAMLAVVVLLVVYAQFVGGGASVDRATLMAVVYFGARAIDHRGSPLNALAAVAAILVVTNPLSILDPAFLLTFGATLAILIVCPGRGSASIATWNIAAGIDARRIGVSRAVAAADRRHPVRTRHVGWTRFELSGDSIDGRRANCGHDADARGAGFLAGGGGDRLGRPRRCGRFDLVREPCPLCSGVDMENSGATARRVGRLLRRAGDDVVVAAQSFRIGTARCRGGALDSRQSVSPIRGKRRRPPARDVFRRRPGGCDAGRVSARLDHAGRRRRPRHNVDVRHRGSRGGAGPARRRYQTARPRRVDTRRRRSHRRCRVDHQRIQAA
jgi:ComEC/Rec2-related protein